MPKNYGIKKLIFIGVIIVMIFSVLACSNKEFSEEKTEDMIEFSEPDWAAPISVWLGCPIKLKHPDENAVFKCSVLQGQFYNLPKEISNTKKAVLEPGETVFWQPEGVDLNVTEKAYVDIILKTDNNIIGYAVLEIEQDNPIYDIKLLKSVLIPKLNDKYQNVTEKQVKAAIEKEKQKGL